MDDNAMNISSDIVDTEEHGVRNTDPRARLLVATDTAAQVGLPGDPLAQLGVMIAAAALACRRVIEAKSGDDASLNRAIRVRLRKAAMADFERKLRAYTTPLTEH